MREKTSGGGGFGYRKQPKTAGGRGSSFAFPLADGPYGGSSAPSTSQAVGGITLAAVEARLRAQKLLDQEEERRKAAEAASKRVQQYQSVQTWTDSGQAYLYGGVGHFVVKRGMRYVPGVNNWDVRSPDRLDYVIPAVAYDNLGAAKDHWNLLAPDERSAWDAAAKAGFKYKGAKFKNGKTLWDKMVTESANYNQAIGGAGMGGAMGLVESHLGAGGMGVAELDSNGNPIYVTNPYMKDKAGNPLPAGFVDPETFIQLSIATGDVTDGTSGNGSTRSGSRGGGGGGGGGGASVTQTSLSTSMSTAEEAKAVLNNAANNYLGRDATPDEAEAFLSALNLKEKANPSKTVTTVSTDGTNTTSSSTTTGGVSADTKMQMGIEDAKSKEDFNDYQMAKYFDIFRQALTR